MVDYLVTGATGLLGNNLVRQIVERGQTARVLIRSQTVPPALRDLPVEVSQGDVRDRRSVEAAARGARYILHAAADTHIGWRHWDRQREVNVTGSRHVAQAARAAGARMVHISSVDALPASSDGTPVHEETPDRCKVACTYVVTKREAEQAVQDEIAQGLDGLIVNPGFMLGPWDWKPSSGRMLLALAKGWTPAAPGGGMSGCDVRDVASGILAAAEKGQTARRYILAGENISYLDAWRLFARTAGRPGPKVRWGPLVRIISGRVGDLWGRITGQETDVNSAMLQMSQMLHYYSSDRARRELGYQTRPFTETVQDAWAWLQDHHRRIDKPHGV